ncbi:hypothetical protein BGZ60DRAFT_411688 [Tricladium varicosporioides]|nr:hypothetical protein BGZ60DRAFT_411688 [Hymenoscyphus varicosporioides]
MNHHHLHGGCSCGRNRYIINIPQDASEAAQVFFDNGAAHRRSQATPLSAWLRVPLSWYQSTTYAFFEDETHNSIRRSYTSPHEEGSQRQFCGFCGTPLSYWTESSVGDADYISLTLGSLAGSDLRDLEDLGLLPQEALEDTEEDTEIIYNGTTHARSTALSREAHEGLPWFETMVEGSRLGKIKKSRGQQQSGNGRYRVEWEIVEWTDEGENEAPGSMKRKLGEVVEDDSQMSGVQK